MEFRVIKSSQRQRNKRLLRFH